MRPEKEKAITNIKENFLKAKGVYLVDFTGMNTEIVNELRTKFRSSDVEYKVVKNTLTKIAVKDLPFKFDEKFFKLPTAIAFSYDEPFTPIRILDEFIKKYDKPRIKCSVIEEKIYDEKDTIKFSKIPSKEVLLGRMLGGFNSPITGFVGVLSGVLRNLASVLNSIKDEKEDN